MSDYLELLKHPYWQKKRTIILQRDNFTCQKCNDTLSTLHIHHLYYNLDCYPWEYPDEALITLCELCHMKEEFYKWVLKHGIRALVYHGFLMNDIEEVKILVFRKVELNHHRESSIEYMTQIKQLMAHGN